MGNSATSWPMPIAAPVTTATRFLCISNRNLLYPDAAPARACRKPSDARSDRLDPIRERLHELLEEFAGAVVDELTMFIEELVGMADIGFGLLHGRHVQKHERLPEMMIGTEGPDRARRTADDRSRLAVPDAASIRPGPTSRAFLRPAGTARLYSDVTNSTASA